MSSDQDDPNAKRSACKRTDELSPSPTVLFADCEGCFTSEHLDSMHPRVLIYENDYCWPMNPWQAAWDGKRVGVGREAEAEGLTPVSIRGF